MTNADLTRLERRLYNALYAARGRLVAYDALLAAMYREREYDRSHGYGLKTYVYRLRLRGIEITNAHGVGYALTSPSVCPACGGPLRRLPV